MDRDRRDAIRKLPRHFRLFWWTPYIVSVIMLAAVIFNIAIGMWSTTTMLIPMIGLLLLMRQGEQLAFKSGWGAAAMRADMILEDKIDRDLLISVRRQLLMDPVTYAEHRRSNLQMLREMAETDDPDMLDKIARKYR